MPTIVLIGHGAYRTSYGAFVVPKNVRIEFFVDDGDGLPDDAAECLERSLHGENGLTDGITDELLEHARGLCGQEYRATRTGRMYVMAFDREVCSAGQVVKNYKLENPIAEFQENATKLEAMRLRNVYAPGGTKNLAKETYLRDIVKKFSGRAKKDDPLVLQWSACRSNFEGDDDVDRALPTPAATKKRRCYLTTAACEALGRKDDCRELTALRWYRDTVLAMSPGGPEEIAAYYRMAPAIVDAIDRRSDRQAIYRQIDSRIVRPAVAAIEAGRYDEARAIYREGTRLLAAELRSRPGRGAKGPTFIGR